MRLLSLVIGLAASGLLATAAPEYPNRGPDLYDVSADGATLIRAARDQARASHRRVLLDFGANWCPWCHALHRLFATDPDVRRELEAGYVLVMIDVNRRHGTDRNADVVRAYGDPTKLGLPVLVVLDADGTVLATQDTGALEKGDGSVAHDPAKVLAFLRHWAPQRPPSS